MSFKKKLKNSTSVDLQLLVYVLGVAESLIYSLVIVTYIGAILAFNKAMMRIKSESDEDFETSKLLEVEAMIQIFGIAIFLTVSIVMISGVKENDHNKLIPYLLLCITQVIVIIIYTIFIYPSWFFIAFLALKLIMFLFTYNLYRRLVHDEEELTKAEDQNDQEDLQPIVKFAVTVGSNVLFKCEIKNLENHQLAWLKKEHIILGIGNIVLTNNQRISVKQNEKSYEPRIAKVTLNDSGTYVCKVNSESLREQIGILEVFENVPTSSSNLHSIES
ncbi:hypothetical protein PVAND_017098 [Polypedilum vanderplanki]|uniref:Ig-like domain-containing protein n=1 Tax=Polypedilum vanderplanki TaxID=319348 RepID=A0A9J6BHB7_POLVA|nr:hypothetical protein PVAND_017098 [Polypedilum vanderplanki]